MLTFKRFRTHRYTRYSAWLLVAGVAVFLAANFVVVLSTYAYIREMPDGEPKHDAVIVLGAAVRENGSLSPTLKNRVDTALALYQRGVGKKLLITGDNKTVDYNEVSPVRTYLLELGVPPEDIFLDYAGFDTYDSMYRARSIFEVRSATIVTQSYHVPRAVFLGRSLGIDAYGFRANGGNGGLKNKVRELAANIKAMGNVLLLSNPEYLGAKIPITGDGRASWGD